MSDLDLTDWLFMRVIALCAMLYGALFAQGTFPGQDLTRGRLPTPEELRLICSGRDAIWELIVDLAGQDPPNESLSQRLRRHGLTADAIKLSRVRIGEPIVPPDRREPPPVAETHPERVIDSAFGPKGLFTSGRLVGDETVVINRRSILDFLAAGQSGTPAKQANALCSMASLLLHESCRVEGEFCILSPIPNEGSMTRERALLVKSGYTNTIKAYDLDYEFISNCPGISDAFKQRKLMEIEWLRARFYADEQRLCQIIGSE